MKYNTVLVRRIGWSWSLILKEGLRFYPGLIFMIMFSASLLLGIIFPLRLLFFYQAFPGSSKAGWMMGLTRELFPGFDLISSLHTKDQQLLAHQNFMWMPTLVLVLVIGMLCLTFLLALKVLPRRVGPRFVLLTTLLLGGIFLLYPSLTSQDVFSYIAYARAGVIYHLNPLIATPFVIRGDPVYPYIYWYDQPSAYGPVWALISSLLLEVLIGVHLNTLPALVLAFRLLTLGEHLGSGWLIWRISGDWAVRAGRVIPRRLRIGAMLMLAWNPLLLFEAGVNAHNDTLILFLLLLACWLLVRWRTEQGSRGLWLVAGALALATCVKITFILLFPGFLLYLWAQPASRKRVLSWIGQISVIYSGLIILLYIPFWRTNLIARLFMVNPGTSRAINSLYEFVLDMYGAVRGGLPKPLGFDTGSPWEIKAHLLSTIFFGALYLLLCGWCVWRPQLVRTLPGLVRWLALIWLLYCGVGSIWFWPWYLVSFIGLATLATVLDPAEQKSALWSWLRLPRASVLLTFSALSVYAFQVWHMGQIRLHSGHIALPMVRGLWVWGILLLALGFRYRRPAAREVLITMTAEPLVPMGIQESTPSWRG